MARPTLTQFYRGLLRVVIHEPTGKQLTRERDMKRREKMVKPQVSIETNPQPTLN